MILLSNTKNSMRRTWKQQGTLNEIGTKRKPRLKMLGTVKISGTHEGRIPREFNTHRIY